MTFRNPDPETIQALFKRVKTIAVVGLSPKPDRPSHGVSRAMQKLGFRIIPVRPASTEILGERSYARLEDIPFPVDLVNVFREPAAPPGLVDSTLAIGAPALWIQEGIVHEAAAHRAIEAGLVVVMDRCIWKDFVAIKTA